MTEGGAVNDAREKARLDGENIAKKLVNEDWLLFECRNDDSDELWLGKAVSKEEWGGKCSEEHTRSKTKIEGVALDKGDFKIAVAWYARLCQSEDHRDFVLSGDGEVTIQNSSELRLAGPLVTQISGPAPARTRARSAARKTEELARENRRTWRLNADAEALALMACVQD